MHSMIYNLSYYAQTVLERMGTDFETAEMKKTDARFAGICAELERLSGVKGGAFETSCKGLVVEYALKKYGGARE